MDINILKKNNEPVVDQSLETTRNIEFQLLNVKKELEKFTENNDPNIDITPAVTHTLETLHQIDTQLQNMNSILEQFTEHLKTSGISKDKNSFDEYTYDGPNRPPGPPRGPPTYPPTYPQFNNEYYQTPQNYPKYYPWEMEKEHYSQYDHPGISEQYYYSDTPPNYWDSPYYRPPPYRDYYPTFENPYYYRYSRGHYQQNYLPPYQNYGDSPNYYTQDRPDYYQSKRYPTVASSEPAYSSTFRAVPSATYKIAYYPWQQMSRERTPANSRVPYMNIYDVGSEYLMYIELPGVEKDNLELRVDEQALWISGKPTILGTEEGQPVVQEHGYHEFYRQVNLPSKIIQNKTSCIFENGILKIKLVKSNPKKSAHKVKIH
jgi:HSP20 family protein